MNTFPLQGALLQDRGSMRDNAVQFSHVLKEPSTETFSGNKSAFMDLLPRTHFGGCAVYSVLLHIVPVSQNNKNHLLPSALEI